MPPFARIISPVPVPHDNAASLSAGKELPMMEYRTYAGEVGTINNLGLIQG